MKHTPNTRHISMEIALPHYISYANCPKAQPMLWPIFFHFCIRHEKLKSKKREKGGRDK